MEANRGPERDHDGHELRREQVGELRREGRDQLRAVLLLVGRKAPGGPNLPEVWRRVADQTGAYGPSRQEQSNYSVLAVFRGVCVICGEE